MLAIVVIVLAVLGLRPGTVAATAAPDGSGSPAAAAPAGTPPGAPTGAGTAAGDTTALRLAIPEIAARGGSCHNDGALPVTGNGVRALSAISCAVPEHAAQVQFAQWPSAADARRLVLDLGAGRASPNGPFWTNAGARQGDYFVGTALPGPGGVAAGDFDGHAFGFVIRAPTAKQAEDTFVDLRVPQSAQLPG